MVRRVTAHGRSGDTVTVSGARASKVVAALGGRLSRVVRGRSHRAAVTGICAITLAFGVAGRASASPPLGEDVTGAAAITLTMGVAATGTVVGPVTGACAITLDLAVESHGLAFAPVTGTSAITLDLGVSALGEVYAIPGVVGAAAIPLTLGVAAVGTHTPLVTGAATIVLPLGVAAVGTFQPMVTGTSAIALAMAVAGAGRVGAVAPASVISPVVGTDLLAVWNRQNSGTGPRTPATNGTWAGSLDAYLLGKGFVIGNDNGALWLNIGSSTVTVSSYNFLNCPRIQYRGTGTLNWVDCAFDNVANPDAGVRGPLDINGSPTGENITVNFINPLFNITTIYADSGSWTATNPRYSNQKQMIWGSAGATMLNINPYITGGGCDPPSGAHVELIQYNAAPGKTFRIEGGMINFTDGQATMSPWGSGWTAVFTSPLGGMIELVDCIITGVIAMNANPLFPTGMVAYGVTYNYGNLLISNCVLDIAQYGYTSGNGTPLTQSGNRTFANVALVAGDFG